jgi:hypothetical protein
MLQSVLAKSVTGGAIELAIECRGVGGGPMELSMLLEGSDENPMSSTCS